MTGVAIRAWQSTGELRRGLSAVLDLIWVLLTRLSTRERVHGLAVDHAVDHAMWAWSALDRGLAGDRTGRQGTPALWVACAGLPAESGALWWLSARGLRSRSAMAAPRWGS